MPLPDLTTLPAALRVQKRPDPVTVIFAPAPGICETLEGPVHYTTGDAILTGPHGEHWPVQRSQFESFYSSAIPGALGKDGQYLKDPTLTLALRLSEPLTVPVGWQNDPLQGRPGDWLLRYSDASHGIIQDKIFRETYGPAANEKRWPPP